MTREKGTYRLWIGIGALLLCFLQAAGIDMHAQEAVKTASNDTILRQREPPKARARRNREHTVADSARKDSAALLPRNLQFSDSLSVTKMQLTDSLDAANKREVKRIEEPVSLVVSPDSLPPVPTIKPKTFIPNPTKATWLAVAFPGGGQIYNRKFWKLPIIYGGFAGCAYALTWNGKMYKDYSQAYMDIMDNNPDTDSYKNLLPANYSYSESQLQTILKNRKDRFRRYRDLSIFAFIGVYLISIIDAYVDAELSNFDISPDLTMHPTVIDNCGQSGSMNPKDKSVGMQWVLHF